MQVEDILPKKKKKKLFSFLIYVAYAVKNSCDEFHGER